MDHERSQEFAGEVSARELDGLSGRAEGGNRGHSHVASPTPLPVQEGRGGPDSSANRRSAPAAPATILTPPEQRPQPSASPVAAITGALGLEGEYLGHFQIEHYVGGGGMGCVLKARDLRLQRPVALKVLPREQAGDADLLRRFQREAEAAARLDHENVARVYFIGEDQGLHYIAFEYVEGPNLYELIAQYGTIPLADAVNYTLQIAGALVHAHKRDVVHRDIKPSNVIITSTGRAKLVDLGLARHYDPQGGGEITESGTTLGTFDYISPEQARDPRAADIRSDIYSLGCTLYHMLTGRPPYPGGTLVQKLLQHQKDEPPDARSLNPDVPDELAAILRRMMAKEPHRRYQDPEQLVRDLMLLAGEMGLRSAGSDGLVWVAPELEATPVWLRLLGWSLPVLTLLVGVLVIQGFLLGPEDEPLAMERLGAPPPPAAAPADPGDEAAQPIADEGGQQNVAAPRGESQAVPDGETQRDAAPGQSQGDSGAPPERENGSGEEGAPISPAPRPAPAEWRPADAPAGTLAAGPAGGGVEPVTAASGLGMSGDEGFGLSLAGTTAIAVAGPEVEEPGTGSQPSATPHVRVVDPTGRTAGSYATLAAALENLPSGTVTVVELRYDGRPRGAGGEPLPPELPIVLNNVGVTIRAADGFRPLLALQERRLPAQPPDTHMITVVAGSLELVNIDVELVIPESVSADRWSVFRLQAAERLRLQGCTVTVRNTALHDAAMVEIAASADVEMPAEGQTPLLRFPTGLDFQESVLRVGGGLVRLRHLEDLRINLGHDAIALSGALLEIAHPGNAPLAGEHVELRIDHVTARIDGGLLRMDSGSAPEPLLPVSISATNNLFFTTTGMPVLNQTGNQTSEDLYRLVTWSGERNAYDGFEQFWEIAPQGLMQDREGITFEQWRARESDARESIDWAGSPGLRPVWEVVPADFELAPEGEAVGAANDGTNLGADLRHLPVAAAGER